MSKLEIARRVLDLAASIDRRVTATEARAKGWAEVFDGSLVSPDEAMAAVKHHYSKPNPRALMPGDVIAYCNDQPAWSSVEHAHASLDLWSRYPFAPSIEEYTGIRQPDYSMVAADASPRDRRANATELHKAWIDENRERLVAAILERRHTPPKNRW